MTHDLNQSSWLRCNCPGFYVNGDNIQVILSPHLFYQTLIDKISNANDRITISSLYIGTGEMERRLVDAIDNQMCDKPHLQVCILLDRLRGTRGDPNSLTLLLPLIRKHKDRIQLYLYTTPVLTGYKLLIPQRFNEALGVQHIKAYIFDNDLIISGCNLSELYFTHRQDRYLLLRDTPSLIQYVDDVVKTVCLHSERVTGQLGRVSEKNALFSRNLGKAIDELIRRYTREPIGSESDTVIHPTLQMYHHGIKQDQNATCNVFAAAASADLVHISSGYFNMPDLYTDTLASSRANFSVLAASEHANGFYGAQGISRHITTMYMRLSNLFLRKIANSNGRIKYYEFKKDNWSFHAKGVWFYRNGDELPSLTMIGSPNYGYRSVWRDLELQFFIQSNNLALKQELHCENRTLFHHSTTSEISSNRIKTDRHVATYLKLVTRFLRGFL